MSKELVRKLKAARELVGETQVVFAERLGVPTRTLIGWENDQRTPRGLALKALNDALDTILKGKK
jgi:DNA-binding transcriptional regulator YiaG